MIETSGQLVLTGVDKAYGFGSSYKQVVRDCSCTIEPGKLTVIIGPSGCGKSTLIRLLAGFERPTRGTITLDGSAIEGPSRERLVLFQESALFPWMTTYDNIMYGPRARGEDTERSRAFAEALLERFGLQAFRRHYPPQLSGGMQRRAELARAIINEPKVMILDEPFRGLDALTKELMWDYYAKLFDEARRTSVFVTTEIDEAVFLADRILVMTNIPTRVRAALEVPVPRPRALRDPTTLERLREIKEAALELLREEALKSFTTAAERSPA